MMLLSALLCIACYLTASLAQVPFIGLLGCAVCGFSVGIFWPGTISITPRVLPGGGTAMYALLALAGDVGCSAGPTLVGLVADATGGTLKASLLPAVLFPILLITGLMMLKHYKTAEA